jgi:integrase
MQLPYRAVAAACYFAGLRVSEALGLQWGDLDFRSGTVSIERQLGSGADFVPLKSAASRATMPMLPALARELQALRPAGAIPHPAAPVFPKGDRHNAARAIRNAGKACGFASDKPLSPHDLRHSIGSELLARGVPLPDVSRFLRHADVRITAQVYAHSLDNGLTSTAERLTAGGFGI